MCEWGYGDWYVIGVVCDIVKCVCVLGVMLFDIVEIYGLGKSECIFGEVFGDDCIEVVVVSKVFLVVLFLVVIKNCECVSVWWL